MKNILITVLSILILLQSGYIVRQKFIKPAEELQVEELPWVTVGDNLNLIDPELNITEPTVVLVFNSQCGHCKAVAPVWAEWLSTTSDHVVAITTDSFEVGEKYAEDAGWNVPVVSVSFEVPRSPQHMVVARTPWIFVVDENGIVLKEGHGQEVKELTS